MALKLRTMTCDVGLLKNEASICEDARKREDRYKTGTSMQTTAQTPRISMALILVNLKAFPPIYIAKDFVPLQDLNIFDPM